MPKLKNMIIFLRGDSDHFCLIKTTINFLNKLKYLSDCNLFIITVPTPVFKNKDPDLSHLRDVCKKLSKVISTNSFFSFLKIN